MVLRSIIVASTGQMARFEGASWLFKSNFYPGPTHAPHIQGNRLGTLMHFFRGSDGK
jgi:hypothetical protein